MHHQRQTKRSVSRSISSTPGFFETLAIPIVRGRAFDDRDSQPGRQSVVVDQGLAARLWSDADPIGQTLFVQGKPHEVIGVAQYKGVRPGGAAPGPSLFRADWASAAASGRMLVRVRGDARTMLPWLREEIVAVDPNVAISEALPLSRLTENMYAEVPLAMRVVGYAGGLGLLLTAIGLYGVLALAVGQRTREIGVRMALGARVPSVLRLILREGIALALAGLGLGLASAVVLSRLLTRFLYGITPNDPATYGVAVGWWQESRSRRAQYPPGGPQGSIRWWLCVTSRAEERPCAPPDFLSLLYTAIPLSLMPARQSLKVEASNRSEAFTWAKSFRTLDVRSRSRLR